MKTDSQSIKKQLEVLIMEYFRTNFTDFPKGRLRASESPDFVLDTSQRSKIGVELTRLYFNNLSPEKVAIPDKIQNEIVEKAQEFYELTSPSELFVKVRFSDKCKVIQEKQLMLSVLIANVARESVKTKKAGSFFSICQKTNLPDEIEAIFMATHPVLSESVWEVAGLPKNSFETLQLIRQLISKKEDKLQLYQKRKLNQYWLIITADSLNNKQKEKFHHLIFNSGNSHQFQKIFLFDLLKAQIIQIL